MTRESLTAAAVRLAFVVAIGPIVVGCRSRSQPSLAEADVVGRYRANFPDRIDEIELFRGGQYRHTTDHGTTHDKQTGQWFLGQFQSQAEITLRDFRFTWPSGVRSLPPGGIGNIRQFSEVADWTTPIRVDDGIVIVDVVYDPKFHYRKQ
jgi:hypothetical protein